MRILHLSDTHLYGDPSARHYDRIDTAAALRGLLARLGELGPLDAVVHTGDASEDGTAASYRLLHEILEPVAAAHDAALVVTMGNHDVSAVYGETLEPGQRVPGSQDRVVDLPRGGRVVVLDSSVPGAGYGHLDPAQTDWLREVLATPAGPTTDGRARGTVLAIHHPPLVAATPLLRALDLDQLDVLAGALAGGDVRAILSGHYHHPMSGALAGVPVHVVPGVTNVVDPLGAGERESALALSGASLVEIEEGGADGALPTGPAAVRVTTSVLPNAGDPLADPTVPVYDFSPEQVAAIIEAAGR